jgi:hypothetical protein
LRTTVQSLLHDLGYRRCVVTHAATRLPCFHFLSGTLNQAAADVHAAPKSPPGRQRSWLDGSTTIGVVRSLMNPPRKKNRSLAERDKPALERVGRRRRHPGHRDLRRFLAEFLMKTVKKNRLVVSLYNICTASTLYLYSVTRSPTRLLHQAC